MRTEDRCRRTAQGEHTVRSSSRSGGCRNYRTRKILGCTGICCMPGCATNGRLVLARIACEGLHRPAGAASGILFFEDFQCWDGPIRRFVANPPTTVGVVAVCGEIFESQPLLLGANPNLHGILRSSIRSI